MGIQWGFLLEVLSKQGAFQVIQLYWGYYVTFVEKNPNFVFEIDVSTYRIPRGGFWEPVAPPRWFLLSLVFFHTKKVTFVACSRCRADRSIILYLSAENIQ